MLAKLSGKKRQKSSDQAPPAENVQRQNGIDNGVDLQDAPVGQRNGTMEEQPVTPSAPSSVVKGTSPSAEDVEGKEQVGENIVPMKASITENATGESPYDKILAVIIHRTDRIKSKRYITHPMVKVHVVNADTGEYAKKSQKHRAVAYANEVIPNRPDAVDYILPLMTKPSHFRQKDLSAPKWEELLLFNDDFGHFVNDSNNIMLLFELLDFKSMAAMKRDATGSQDAPIQIGGTTQSGKSDVWYRIAWAFLKLVGSNGAPNAGQNLRLQLYKAPPARQLRDDRKPEVYRWWKNGPRVKYAGTLFVSVKPVDRPRNVPSASRSQYAVQQEAVTGKGSSQLPPSASLPDDALVETASANEDKDEPQYSWTRLPGQPCKVPNKLAVALFCGREGCFRLKFSSNGRYLAGAGAEMQLKKFPIYIYGYPTCKLSGILYGHIQLVYELSWNSCELLLSASADCTARLWNVTRMRCSCTMAHTTFVYCARFHPNDHGLVFTGAFDKRIRLWSLKRDEKPKVIQEFEQQSSYINSVCFTTDNRFLYSGDGAGVICIWAAADDSGECWMFIKEVRESRIAGKPINALEVHPDQKRLFIQTRDGFVRALELRSLALRVHYHGLRNADTHLRGDLSPCGTLYFAGDGDGRAVVWNVQSGQVVAEYNDLSLIQCPVACVSYHPFDHTVAFGIYGSAQSVMVYKYEVAEPQLCNEQPQDKKIQKQEGPSFDPDYSLSKLLEEHKLLTKVDLPTGKWLKNRANAAYTNGGIRIGAKISKTSITSDAAGVAAKRVTFGDDIHHLTSPAHRRRQEAFANRDKQQSTLMEIPIDQSARLDGHSARIDDSALGKETERKQTRPITLPVSGAGLQCKVTQQPAMDQRQATKATSEVRAKYNYKAQNEDEITFQKGDVIKVVKRDDQWWVGYVTEDKIGYFPSNYVAEMESQ